MRKIFLAPLALLLTIGMPAHAGKSAEEVKACREMAANLPKLKAELEAQVKDRDARAASVQSLAEAADEAVKLSGLSTAYRAEAEILNAEFDAAKSALLEKDQALRAKADALGEGVSRYNSQCAPR